MRVLITGADGFLAKNLLVRLQEAPTIQIVRFTREHNVNDLSSMLTGVDFVFHLAGVNRSEFKEEFFVGNADLTRELCNAIRGQGRAIPTLFASSIQAVKDNDYGMSKLSAEEQLEELRNDTANPVFIYRLPNIFGKWARPNYNSVVATFCYNVARGLPVNVHDPKSSIELIHVDDVVDSFVGCLEGEIPAGPYLDSDSKYEITIGELAEQIQRFNLSRDNLMIETVGNGFLRALYSTYVSYLPSESFHYPLKSSSDERGVFVEMLKTPNAGQFSFFTAHPGVTRGGHFHNTKTEKFLVLNGRARFRFRHIITNEYYEVQSSGEEPMIVESVPGWAHDVTNVGDSQLICMLWANEVFDQDNPDTFLYCFDGTP